MRTSKHLIAPALLALPLLAGAAGRGSGQTLPEQPARTAQGDLAGGGPGTASPAAEAGASPCAYVALFSPENGVPGASADDPERDEYGYTLVGDACQPR